MQTLSGHLDGTPEVDALTEFEHRMALVALQMSLMALGTSRTLSVGTVDRTGAWVIDPTTARIIAVSNELHDLIWS